MNIKAPRGGEFWYSRFLRRVAILNRTANFVEKLTKNLILNKYFNSSLDLF